MVNLRKVAQRTISLVNVRLKTNVSETNSVSIIRVDVRSGHN
jgi:hypothetical protein